MIRKYYFINNFETNIIDKLGSFLFNHIAGSSAFPLNFTCGVSNIAEIENSFNAYKL